MILIKEKLKSLYSLLFKCTAFLKKHYFLSCFIMSLLTVFATEIFSRRSLLEAICFVFTEFDTYCVSVSIVMMSVSVFTGLKKRNFWKFFMCGFWVLMSVISYIMFSFRLMPFSFMDLLLIPSTFTVIPRYLSVFQMIFIGVAVVSLIWLITLLYKKVKPIQDRGKYRYVFLAVILLLTVLYYNVSVDTGIVDNRVTGLITKYERNGFVYCYTSSMINQGIDKPDNYSAHKVNKVIERNSISDSDERKQANIIFLQLESFFDVNNIKEISFSENPVPNFNKLEEIYSHGYLGVPTFSAGTANTEFEVLTGMNIDFFGIGEFPYQTVADTQTVESICYNLKDYGYTNHAIHNNSAVFYDRNIIYSNLGFDTFTSVEYMYDVEYNVLGWARDRCLIPAITDALDSTPGYDMVYTIGVQSHGTYPDDAVDTAKQIEVFGIEDESVRSSYKYYISQMHEVDAFVGELTELLDKRNEPTVVVIFGDHMPGFEVEDSQLSNDSKYQTEYIIYSNFEMEHREKDIRSYQLYSYVFERLNITNGVIPQLHRKYKYNIDDKYLSDLELIQYDMIEGFGTSYNGKKPQPSNLKLGVLNISAKGASCRSGTLTVTGENFNPFSKVVYDGDVLETEYVSSNTVTVSEFDGESDIPVTVGQIDENGNILSTTNYVTIDFN